MLKKNLILMMAFASMVSLVSCDNNEPKNPNDDITYPTNSIIWPEDTTVVLDAHFVVAKGTSLYIEPGVTIIADNEDLKPEIIILGNLYAMGTSEKQITFTVPDKFKTDRFSRMWGGVICGYESEEVLLSNCIFEYAGAETTEESFSFQYGLFKTETGNGVPAFHFCNVDGAFVIENCIFRNNAEDHVYITGGRSIITNNLFHTSGYDGGEAINYKSGCFADICYNMIYDANTNALKLSNTGVSIDIPSSEIVVYNNTILNTGWRRPKVKGGSIWLESNILAHIYNNLVADCRWGLKRDTDEGENVKSILTPNYYFSSTQVGVIQNTANETQGIINAANDIVSTYAGEFDPQFENFTQQSNININTGSDPENQPAVYNTTWDFHLKAGSPALAGGTINFARNFSSTGITFEGIKALDDATLQNTYNSPAPSTYFGAFGTK